MTKSKLWPRSTDQWPPAYGLASVGPRDLRVSVPSHTQTLSPVRLSALVNISVLFPGKWGLWSSELAALVSGAFPEEDINLKLDIFYFFSELLAFLSLPAILVTVPEEQTGILLTLSPRHVWHFLHAKMCPFSQGQAMSILCPVTLNNNLYLSFLSACLGRSLLLVTASRYNYPLSCLHKCEICAAMFAIMNA